MNKAEFLKELHDILAGKLPPEELDDVLSYYEAYFADSEEDEETVAERLAPPPRWRSRYSRMQEKAPDRSLPHPLLPPDGGGGLLR